MSHLAHPDPDVSRETLMPPEGVAAEDGENSDMDPLESALERFLLAAEACGVAVSAEQRGLLAQAATWLAALGHSSGISGYDDADSALMRGMGPALAYFAADGAPRRGRLADIGAGNGAIGAALAILEQNLVVDLVDRAQRAYTACEILSARLAVANIQAIRADIRALPAASYDSAVFRAFTTGERALVLVARIVRPGGFMGAFHRPDDPAFEHPPRAIQRLGSWPTLVDGLVLSGYRL